MPLNILPWSTADLLARMPRMVPDEASAMQHNNNVSNCTELHNQKPRSLQNNRTCAAARWCNFLLAKQWPLKQGALVADSIMVWVVSRFQVCVVKSLQLRSRISACMHGTAVHGRFKQGTSQPPPSSNQAVIRSCESACLISCSLRDMLGSDMPSGVSQPADVEIA